MTSPNNPTPLRGVPINLDQRSPIRYDNITPPQRQQIAALALRAMNMAKQFRVAQPSDKVIEESSSILQADFATVFLLRKLDLRAMMLCDDLTFMSELANIQKFIVRPNNYFPPHVRLRFARSGERVTP